MLLNITNNMFFIEQYNKKLITISTIQNNNGILEVDDLGNALSSAYFTLGDVEFGILTKYDYTDSLLVYDTIGYDLYNKSEQIDMMIEWNNGTNYKIGSRTEKSILYSETTNTFTFSKLSKLDDTIFKAYVNNYEIPRIDLAVIEDGNIQVVGNSRDKLSGLIGGNDMVVILYKTDQTITTDITIEYNSVDSIIDIESMIDYSYFDNNAFSKSYNNIKSISDSVDVITTKVGRRRQTNFRQPTTSITNRITLEMYEDTKYDSLASVKTDEFFRIISIGTMPTEITIWNNCIMNPSNTSRFDKEFNTMSFSITYDNKQRILLDDNEKVFKFYNDGVYNGEVYG